MITSSPVASMVPSEDRNFVNLWKKTTEYVPSDLNYLNSLKWNLSAIERGRFYADIIEGYLPLYGKRALDIGCGSGGVCIAFAQQGAICTGLEPSATRFEWAMTRIRDHNVQVNLLPKMLEDANFHDGTFDIITATDVLEHVDDYRAVLRKMCDLLDDNGLIFATVPNCFHIKNILTENHTGLFGLLLLPMKWRPFYVVKIRKAAKSHQVSHFPPAHKLVAICHNQGLVVLEPAGIAKLHHPEWISRRWLQNMVRTLVYFRTLLPVYYKLISWFALPSTFTLVAQKREQP